MHRNNGKVYQMEYIPNHRAVYQVYTPAFSFEVWLHHDIKYIYIMLILKFPLMIVCLLLEKVVISPAFGKVKGKSSNHRKTTQKFQRAIHFLFTSVNIFECDIT